MRLPRRQCAGVAAAAAAVTTLSLSGDAHSAAAIKPPLDAIRAMAQRYEVQQAEMAAQQTLDAQSNAYNEQDLELESELLDSLLAAPAGARESALETAQMARVNTIIRQLESTRGRQQRAGWGQSDNRYDLPYIGSWNIIYTTEQSISEPVRAGGDDRGRLALVSARQWIYGPGRGGAALECVYSLPDGPRSGSMLVTRAGDVTKQPSSAVRLDFPPERSRRYELSYTVTEAKTLQQSDGRWADVTTSRPTSTPSVGTMQSEGPQQALLCAPPSLGLLETTYLSDVLWVVRTTATGAATVLQRTEEEALRPQNGDGPDGFDAQRFGPSGRRIWMFDTGFDDREAAYQRGRQRVRADAEISGS